MTSTYMKLLMKRVRLNKVEKTDCGFAIKEKLTFMHAGKGDNR